MSVRFKAITIPLFPQDNQLLSIVEGLLALLVIVSPYYWLPVISLQVWTGFKYLIVGSLFLLFFIYISQSNAEVILPNKRLSILLLTLPVTLLPGIINISNISGLKRYFDYILLIPILVVYLVVVRHRGVAAIRRYRHYVVLAMIPQVGYVFLAATGVIAPFTMPPSFGNTIEPYSAGFSAVQTQFSVSIAILVPLLAGYVARAYEESLRAAGLWLLVFVPVLVAFIGSHGRSGIMAGAIGLATFVVLYNRRLALGMVGAASVVALLILSVFTESIFRFFKLGSSLNHFTSNRVTLFSKGLEQFIHAPLIGIGFGNRTLVIDNLYLITMIEGGILPAIIIVAFLGLTIVSGYRVVHHFSGTEHELLATSLFAAVICYLPVTLFENGVIFLNFFLNVGWWVCFGSLMMLPVLQGDRFD